MRYALLVVALVFIALMGAATVNDVIHHGVGVLDILAGVVLVLFCTGIVGALLHRPPPYE